MDEELVLREIVKNMAFEIEAVNQNNVLKWSTTNGTPLNIKVRVRNKDESRLLQRGTMPMPRIGISAPEKLALVASNQTILSFSVYLQEEFEKKEEHKRHSAFKIFNIGNCLGTYRDDEGPYLPSSSNQNPAASDNSITSNTVHRNKKRLFGKCKPGGCLDPPFGEDKYSYGLSKTVHLENLQVELNEIEDNKQTSKPGGCLDSSLSEEKHPNSLPKTDHQEKIKLKLSETSNNSTEPRKKTSERSREREIFIQMITKDESDPNKLTDIYTRTSEENSLKKIYSNSVITYPTDMPSKERIYERIPTASLRQSYENPESYFVPSKDVKRYKEDERRHVKRLSVDQISRSSKVAANDITDKSIIFRSISKESKCIPQNTKGTKDIVKDKTNLTELQQNDIELAIKISVNKYETATSHVVTTSEHLDILKASESRLTENYISNLKLQRQIISTISIRKSDIDKTENLQDDKNIAGIQLKQDIPSTKSASRETISKFSPQESNKNQTKDFQYDVDVVELHAKQEIQSTRYTGKEAMSTLSIKTTYKNKTENLEDSINTAKMKIKEDKPLTRGFSGEAMSKLSPSKAPYSSRTQILDSQNAQNQEQVDVEEQPMPALERFVNTDIKTPTNFNKEKKYGNKTDDEMFHYKKAQVIDAVTRNLTTFVTENQYLPSKDKPNVLTNSLISEKDIVSLSTPEGHPQGRNVSPNYISSTENIEFDISSSHSMDFKNELSSQGKTNSLLDSPRQKGNWLSVASNNIKEKDDLIDINLTSEPEQRKASAIFQKKTFVTKQDSNIHNDDISKATPLKRNTFTIIGSEISLQKSEEIEEMPEDTPDVHLKITDIIKSGSPGITRDNTEILDNINKKSEDNIHANFDTSTIKQIKEGDLKDISSKIIGSTTPIFDEQPSIKGESLDRKISANTFISGVDKSLKQNIISDQTNNQTEIAKGVEPVRVFQSLQIESLDTKDQAEYTKSKDISGHPKITDGEIIPTYNIDRKAVPDGAMSNKIELLEEYSKLSLDSLQISILKNEQKSHKTMYDAEAASTTRNYDKLEDVFIKDNEISIYNNGKSIIETTQNPTTKNEKEIFSEITENDNLVPIKPTSDKLDHLDENFTNINNNTYNTSNNGSSQNLISENDRDLHSVMTGKIYDKTEHKEQIYIKPDSENTKQENAQLADDNKDVSSGQLIDKNMFNNELTDKFISENIRDFHSVMTGKIHDKTEFVDQIYTELDSAKPKTSASNILPINELEIVPDLHAQTIDDIQESEGTDQTYHKNVFLDTENNESTQKSVPKHVQDLHLGVARQIHSNTELKNQIWLDLDNKDVPFEQLLDKGMFLDTGNKKPTQQFILEHLKDLHSEITDQIPDKTEVKSKIYNLKYTDAAKEDSVKMKQENVKEFHERTAYRSEFVTSDQNDKNSAFLDAHSIQAIQKFIPEHAQDLHPAMSNKNQDKIELNDRIYNETDKFKYSESSKDKLLEITSDTAQDLHSHTTGHIKNVPFGLKYEKSTYLNTIQNVLLEDNRDLHSAIIDEINDKAKLNDQQYNKLVKFIYNELATDDLLNHVHTADQNEYLISDQKHNKKTFIDPDSNKAENETETSDIVDHDVSSKKYHDQIELAQNLIENHYGFKEKSRSASKTSSPFSGYSGLISEVLSNISENTEGEEKQLTRIKVVEENSNRLEDVAVSDIIAYRDDEIIDKKLAKIDRKSGLLARPSENIDTMYKIDDGSYKVPQNSLAKSFTSTLEESDGEVHKETIVKAFESIQTAHSSDKLRQTNKFNIVRENLHSATNITNQNSEYQASKNLASVNDSVELKDDDFAITHNVEPTLLKQNESRSVKKLSQLHSTVNEPKIGIAETFPLKTDTVYLDMSFYSYMNDNYQRVVQTHSPQIEQHRPHDGTVTVVKTLIRHGNEIRIPVDRENDISLNILGNDVRICNKGGTIGSPLKHTSEKHLVDLPKRHDDVINKNLALIYEHELIPLHNVIKDLAQEVNTLSTQQERLQVRIRNAKRTKSLRLIPVVKRCGCRRD